MIIHLRKSVLFTVSPDKRFAKEHNLPEGFWTEVWRRKVFLEYSNKDICDYYTAKTGRKTTKQAMARWLWRSEVYSRAHTVIVQGVQVVNSDFFGRHEMAVVKELLKNMKSSVTKKSRTVI